MMLEISPQFILHGLGVLGSLASMISVADLIYARRKQGKPFGNERQELQQAEQRGEFANLASPENVKSLGEIVISPEILEAAFKNIERAKTRYASALDDILNNEQDKEFEKERVKAAVNKMLSLIEEFNGGQLPPGDEWQKLAISFQRRRAQ